MLALKSYSIGWSFQKLLSLFLKVAVIAVRHHKCFHCYVFFQQQRVVYTILHICSIQQGKLTAPFVEPKHLLVTKAVVGTQRWMYIMCIQQGKLKAPYVKPDTFWWWQWCPVPVGGYTCIQQGKMRAPYAKLKYFQMMTTEVPSTWWWTNIYPARETESSLCQTQIFSSNNSGGTHWWIYMFSAGTSGSYVPNFCNGHIATTWCIQQMIVDWESERYVKLYADSGVYIYVQ